MNQTFHTNFEEMDAYNGRFDFILFLVENLYILLFLLACCFVYMKEEDNVVIYVSEAKQPRAFGLQSVVILTLLRLPWISREPTAIKEAR
jgi:hypothetical protein